MDLDCVFVGVLERTIQNQMIDMMRDIVLGRKTACREVVLERITWIIGDNDNEFGTSFECCKEM